MKSLKASAYLLPIELWLKKRIIFDICLGSSKVIESKGITLNRSTSLGALIIVVPFAEYISDSIISLSFKYSLVVLETLYLLFSSHALILFKQ